MSSANILPKSTNPKARKPYTVRYWHEGSQRERSFVTQREAKDFKAKFEHDSREQIFIDPRQGNERFQDAAERWVSRLTGAENTKQIYRRILRNHINPVIGDRPLRSVAADRDGIRDLLLITLPAKLSPSQVRTAYQVIRAVVNDAVKTGKLPSSRLAGITLPAVPSKADFVFPDHGQLEKMAMEIPEPYGLTIWLMRGCGLRLGEVLAVRKDSFTNGTLRIREQLGRDGAYVPLKHRKPGEWRDIPVPSYVAEKAAEAAPEPSGYLFRPMPHRNYTRRFNAARDKAGIAGSFTPHSLRHVFASVALGNGIPITDVSRWLGHASIQMTFGIYGHLVPASWDKARAVLDREYEDWSKS